MGDDELKRLIERNGELWARVNLLRMCIDPQSPLWPRPKTLREARRQLDDFCQELADASKAAAGLMKRLREETGG